MRDTKRNKAKIKSAWKQAKSMDEHSKGGVARRTLAHLLHTYIHTCMLRGRYKHTLEVSVYGLYVCCCPGPRGRLLLDDRCLPLRGVPFRSVMLARTDGSVPLRRVPPLPCARACTRLCPAAAKKGGRVGREKAHLRWRCRGCVVWARAAPSPGPAVSKVPFYPDGGSGICCRRFAVRHRV